MEKRRPLWQKAIKSFGDATGIVPEANIQGRRIGKVFKKVLVETGSKPTSKIMEEVFPEIIRTDFGFVLGSLRRFFLPLSSRYNEAVNRRTEPPGFLEETLGRTANAVGDILILAGGIASGVGFGGFLLYKGITNLATLWTTDIVTDVRENGLR